MIELLAPAGDMEKLKTAIYFGADAVYFGGEVGGLRAGADNLSIYEIKEAVQFLHKNDKKGYLTLNIYPHNDDIEILEKYIKRLKDIPIDAFIVSDPGVMCLLKKIIPDAEIHLSTQANTTNYMTAEFWAKLGISRIVTAREMTLEDIKKIHDKLPENIEIESFLHGAMCISYSGRCLLSTFMTGRDGNRGACTHPCRWEYNLVEKKRENEYYPIYEDKYGTYIMNSKDLCMIDKIKEMAEAGIKSFKIEGRMKSSYYVATVVRAYRAAIDDYEDLKSNHKFDPTWLKELSKASHREFYHGFYFGNSLDETGQNYLTSDYERTYSFVGVVKEDLGNGLFLIEQRNKFSIGDEIEIFGKSINYFTTTVKEMFDEDGYSISSAPHPKQLIKIKLPLGTEKGFMLRKRKGQ